ncbi:hypothetical protein COMA2_80089 [Candidatus Nitrospira nitrificans]|uniref:Uncharacterized protein n=1 Tax=Candidatus Nitrospira nitrificans TaxID=1742973 RepID=A0A0S4LQT3_9BACT|nr:hypothetical protein COMA2_80089 [Candidatus Nitrospira nitrificans]
MREGPFDPSCLYLDSMSTLKDLRGEVRYRPCLLFKQSSLLFSAVNEVEDIHWRRPADWRE